MTSGGARSRSGPAPDPNSARSDNAGWTIIPAAGRGKPAPEWPLTAPTGREVEMWERFWAKPQAVLWERDGQLEYVAIFVRQLIEAEAEKASAENRKTVRMMFADLWLTSDSMLRARIRIADTEQPKAQPEKAAPKRERRLRVVGDDAQQ